MFKAQLECDGLGCCNEYDLDISHPDDAMMKVEEAERKGWLIDYDDGFCYCPKCKKVIEEEENE
jgi:hypothetical protein